MQTSYRIKVTMTMTINSLQDQQKMTLHLGKPMLELIIELATVKPATQITIIASAPKIETKAS